MSRYFIKQATRHKGALHRHLHVPLKTRIPDTLLTKIARTRVGSTVSNPTRIGSRSIRVNTRLKREVNLARELRRF